MALVALTPVDESYDPRSGNTVPPSASEATPEVTDLIGYIRREFDEMTRFRTSCGIEERLTTCLRQREGRYDPTQLEEIRKFNGSQAYAQITKNKCRGATSMLREIFLGKDRPWTVDPSPVPTLPEDVVGKITELVQTEVQALQAQGQEVPPEAIPQRMDQLMTAAQRAAAKRARDRAKRATTLIDDYLVEGGFYEAMDEYLIDYCTYPYAAMTGPVAVMTNSIVYEDGVPVRKRQPRLTWRRVDPGDLWWTPGATRVEDADFIERVRSTRSQLDGLIGLPGYDEDAVRGAIREYGARGLSEPAMLSHERDHLTNKDTLHTDSRLIDILAFTGRMYGRTLKEYGYEVEDEDFDYMVKAWVCGRFLLKMHIDPDERLRPDYYVASYEPVPGSLAGSALPELMSDLQDVCNAVLRALVNNMAIASGPQVMINDQLIADRTDDELFPWKRWHYDMDPATMTSGAMKAIDFYQPNMNMEQMTAAFQFFSNIADEVSAIPRYLTGNERVGGAGRTASGLSMLMGNANRVLKSVAATIDNHVLKPAIERLYFMILLTTDVEEFGGDERIQVRGATTAEAKEADRMRAIEFLQATANPLDMNIIGPPGRAAVLKFVADQLGMEGEQIVPEPAEVAAQMQAQQAAAQEQQAQQQAQVEQGQQPGQPPQGGQDQAARQAQGGQSAPQPGAGRVGEKTDNQFRVRQQ